jgi:hypothetical protein
MYLYMALTPRKRVPGSYRTDDCVGLTDALNEASKRSFLGPLGIKTSVVHCAR